MALDRVGRYEIRSLIGRGAQAAVYLGFDPATEREVAVKVLNAVIDPSDKRVAGFRREARTVAAIDHRAIIPLYDIGEHEGHFYTVSKYAPGGSLADRIRAIRRPMVLDEALPILTQVADALDAAHAERVIHRDVKPANILLDDDEDVYLGDFGISLRVDAATAAYNTDISGTFPYMSPEQFEGVKVDFASDIYSLAVVAYEMLTGKPPFVTQDLIAYAVMHRHQQPEDPFMANPLLTRPVSDALLRGLAKSPADRPLTATEYVAAITAAAEQDEPIAPPPPHPGGLEFEPTIPLRHPPSELAPFSTDPETEAIAMRAAGKAAPAPAPEMRVAPMPHFLCVATGAIDEHSGSGFYAAVQVHHPGGVAHLWITGNGETAREAAGALPGRIEAALSGSSIGQAREVLRDTIDPAIGAGDDNPGMVAALADPDTGNVTVAGTGDYNVFFRTASGDVRSLGEMARLAREWGLASPLHSGDGAGEADSFGPHQLQPGQAIVLCARAEGVAAPGALGVHNAIDQIGALLGTRPGPSAVLVGGILPLSPDVAVDPASA